ncbi:hypothetical protein OHA25_03230 [Nonomuraea sp. NBC_00507]|uniref:hypothetical protein n=1 Tax=Nonomuraea sp. NBC_00507 TaxID=2976002 RepID=UPI002E184479
MRQLDAAARARKPTPSARPGSAPAFGNQVWKEESEPLLRRLATEVHDEGAAVMIQLTHLGHRTSNYAPVCPARGGGPTASATTPARAAAPVPRGLRPARPLREDHPRMHRGADQIRRYGQGPDELYVRLLERGITDDLDQAHSGAGRLPCAQPESGSARF